MPSTPPARPRKRWWWKLILGPPVMAASVLWLAPYLDENVDPDVRRTVQQSRPAVPDEDNAYLAILGFHVAPADADIHAAGKALREEYRELEAGGTPKGKVREAPRLDVVVELPDDVCVPRARACIRRARETPERMRKVVRENQVLVDRLISMARYPAFQEATQPGAALSGVPYPVKVHMILLNRIALTAVEDGGRVRALGMLAEDTRMMRMVLRGATTVAGKLVGVFSLVNIYHLLSQMVREGPLSSEEDALVQGMLSPLDAAERDVEAALRDELARALRDMDDLDAHRGAAASWAEERFTHLIFMDGASANRLFQHFRDVTAAAGMPAHEFNSRADEVRRRMERDGAPVLNGLGARLFLQLPRDLLELPEGVHDLDGLMRLVAIHRLAVMQGVGASQVATFLGGTPPQLVNPYTQKPMEWDAPSRSLVFRPPGLRDGKAQRIEL
ncbi:MAG: hypothetical protein AB2A00_07695 [Myxococcota bacterium]